MARLRVPGVPLGAVAAVVLATAATAVAPPTPLESALPAPARTVEIDLSAGVARIELVPGRMTEVYAYNGTVPGPAIELREGDDVLIRFRNHLPEETTVHWHGLHLPFDADGSPFHPVAPGESYEYRFTLRPGSAGTYWYHPHPHHHTAPQVARGLYGGVIVRAADDPLPASLTERLLILSDNRFLPDGSLDLPHPESHEGRIDFENGREGDVLFVNGAVLPTFDIRPGEVQRWRVINASAGRYYRLALPGATLLHVGSDGGLFERPVAIDEVLLATAERVELLVRGASDAGTMALTALPYDRYIPQTRPSDWKQPRELARVRVNGQPVSPAVTLPTTLRAVAPLDTLQATATRTMVLTQGFINGLQMDLRRVDVSAPLGATEIWELENLVGMDHPFHLHGFQFQVIDRDGVPEPFPSWKDTVNVPKHQIVRFIVRYENYAGKWMFHCHILDHEDHGMMGVLEVR